MHRGVERRLPVAYIGYMRVSKEKEGGLSPETQRADIEHWATRPGHEREVIFLPPDLDWSGKSLDRPSMQEALRRLRAGEAEGIVVSKLDRLTRSVADLNALIEEARAGKWNLVGLDLGLDLRTSNGKMVAQILGVISEWYLDRLREEQERTIRRKIEEHGAHWGVPFGYRRGYMVNERGHEVAGPLVIDERLAPVVQEVFRRRALPNREQEGGSWRDLALHLTEQGAAGLYERAAAAREGREERGSQWRDTSVRTIIENRVYLGEAKAGSVVKEKAHPALVDELTFRRANKKGTLHGNGARKGGPLLGGGMLRCGTCGHGLYKSSMKTGHWFYRCKFAGCTNRATISARKIEEYLVALACERFQPFEYTTADSGRVDVAEIEAALARIEAEVAEVNASDASFARKAEALTALDVERDALLDELAGVAQTTTREIGPEYLGLLFQVKGDYGLRKEQTPNGGYRWVPDSEAEGYWLDNLLDVPACRKFLRETLGEVTVEPVGGAKTVPVEHRVRLVA
jgi:DNA invertase Pin-like site-specific DNA recombinase